MWSYTWLYCTSVAATRTIFGCFCGVKPGPWIQSFISAWLTHRITQYQDWRSGRCAFKVPCWHAWRCLAQRVLLPQAIWAPHSFLWGSSVPAPVNKQSTSTSFLCSAVIESELLLLVKNKLTLAGWVDLWWVVFGPGRTWLWEEKKKTFSGLKNQSRSF